MTQFKPIERFTLGKCVHIEKELLVIEQIPIYVFKKVC